jgi:hypothetical protein
MIQDRQDTKETAAENNNVPRQEALTTEQDAKTGEREQTAAEQDAALEQQRKEAMTERD